MKNESWIIDYYLTFIKNKAAVFGLVIFAGLLACAIFASFLAPHSPTKQNLELRLMPPFWGSKEVSPSQAPKGFTQRVEDNGMVTIEGTWTYPLGTDDFGRCLLSRILYGARISLYIGLIAVSIALFFGLILGSLAGFYGSWVDGVVMMIINILLSLPAILLAIVVVAMLGPNLTNTMIAIGIVNIPIYTRLIRAEFLQEKEKEYVTASRLYGSSNLRLMFFVILPNCLGPVIVQATMGFASAILEAAGLGFLGLGQPPTPEWGAMLSDLRQYINIAPWTVIFPGLAIFLTVLSFNLMGDGLMDVLDPKAKGK